MIARLRFFKILMVALVIVSGYLNGKTTGRWLEPRQIQNVSEKIKAIPKTIGKWNMVSETDPNENVLEILQCYGYMHRTYVNQQTGSHVAMAIFAGPSGPTSVHTPEICYSSQDFKLTSERVAKPIGKEHEFWVTNFKRKNVHATPFRVYYAWSEGHSWIASSRPRFDFGGVPVLYKLQMSADIRLAVENDDPIQDFLQDFLRDFWTKQDVDK